MTLLSLYMPDQRTLTEILCFKFSYYLGSNNEDKEVGASLDLLNPVFVRQVTPRSLYLVTALLIQNTIVTMEEVYPLVTSPRLTSHLSSPLTALLAGDPRKADRPKPTKNLLSACRLVGLKKKKKNDCRLVGLVGFFSWLVGF